MTAEVAVSTLASKHTTSNIDLFAPINFGPNSDENWFKAQRDQMVANIWAKSKQQFGYGASDVSYFELLGAFGGGVWDGFTGKLDSKGRYVGIQIHKGVEDGFYATDAGQWAIKKGRGYAAELYHFTLGDYRDSSTYAFAQDALAFNEELSKFSFYLYENMTVDQALSSIEHGVEVVTDFASGIWSDVKSYFQEHSSVEVVRTAGLKVGETGADLSVYFAFGGAYLKGAQFIG